jgi:hypothetical protein
MSNPEKEMIDRLMSGAESTLKKAGVSNKEVTLEDLSQKLGLQPPELSTLDNTIPTTRLSESAFKQYFLDLFMRKYPVNSELYNERLSGWRNLARPWQSVQLVDEQGNPTRVVPPLSRGVAQDDPRVRSALSAIGGFMMNPHMVHSEQRAQLEASKLAREVRSTPVAKEDLADLQLEWNDFMKYITGDPNYVHHRVPGHTPEVAPGAPGRDANSDDDFEVLDDC